MTGLLTTPAGVAFLRTPDSAFDGLTDFPWAPSYAEFDGLRMAYVDAGPRDGPVAVLMHGMPTWSYLNRHIIAGLTAAGWRCIAADHYGFGRSDKPVDDGWYSIARHAQAHRRLVEHLDLRDVTLFVQDWGGPIGLTHAAADPDRFSRLVIMNTWLHRPDYVYSDAIRRWNAGWRPGGMFIENIPERLTLGWFILVSLGHMAAKDLYGILQQGIHPTLSPAGEAARRAYDAPFADLGRQGHAGPRRFPLSIPLDDHPGPEGVRQQAMFETLLGWTKPIHFIWGGADGIFTTEQGRAWAAHYPLATFDLLPDAGHFLQDTHGREIADIFLARIAA